ncbi:peptidase dimerization domain-containing protein, partial [Rhizobiaceae sp. 2RAB30]
GHIEDETFSADGVNVTVQGVAIHPGFAKGRMENAIKIAGAIVDRLPKDIAPEMTSDRDGFIHPIAISGALEKATLSFIIRDFREEGLKAKEVLLEDLIKNVLKAYPGSTYRFEVKEQY